MKRPNPLSWVAWHLGSMLLVLLLTGCASGSRYATDPVDIARMPLPDTRMLPHPPDSLPHVTFAEKDSHVKVEMERPYAQMLRTWSAGQRGGFRGAFHSYATLWSLELSLASLGPGRGIEKLSKDLARKLIQRRKENYGETIQIDVYRFDEPPYASIAGLWLDGPGTTIYLEDAQGHRYEPARIETSNRPVEAFFAGETALYGRTMIYFDRIVDNRNLLKSTKRLTLVIDQWPAYTWSFPPHPQRFRGASTPGQ